MPRHESRTGDAITRGEVIPIFGTAGEIMGALFHGAMREQLK